VTNGIRPSLTVSCVNKQAAVIIPDTLAAETKGEFYFLHENQRSYLRSIVGFPLGKVCCTDRTSAQAALVIDINVSNFFTEYDRVFLEFCLREFATRIKM